MSHSFDSAPADASKLSPADINFAPASSRDATVYGACKPGGGSGEVNAGAVDSWAAAVKEQGVTRVVSLLEDRETQQFATSLQDQYAKHFKKADLIPLPEEGAPSADALARVVAALREAHEAGEKCVVHCRAGVARTGLAHAAWLVAQHGLSPEEAKAEVERNAAEHGVKRAVKVEVPPAEQLRSPSGEGGAAGGAGARAGAGAARAARPGGGGGACGRWLLI